MVKKFERNKSRQKRRNRVRAHLSGTQTRPRLCVYKSNKNIIAQIIDDETGNTLVSASTLEKSISEGLESKKDKTAARHIGAEIAKRALDKDIKEVVFDRSGYIYHGKVKELAEGAREAGLKF